MAELGKWIDLLVCSSSSPLDLLQLCTLETTGLKVSCIQRVDGGRQKYVILRMFLKKTAPMCPGSEVPQVLLSSRWGAHAGPLTPGPLPPH